MKWKEIENTNGLYLISDEGDVFSCRSGKKLKFSYRDGYAAVELNIDGVATKHYVHRLVATAFVPNPNQFPIINHKDENPGNNHADNLEWCTHRYNVLYGSAVDRRIEHTEYKYGADNPASRKVYQFDMQGHLIGTYVSAREAAKQTGYNSKSICKAAAGKLKKYMECVWSYDGVFHYDEHKHYENRGGTVYRYDLQGNFIKVYESPDDMRADGLDPRHVQRVCRGERKTYLNNIFTREKQH